MKLFNLLGGAALFAGALVSSPASADYMSDCERLIRAWNTCMAGGASPCEAEEQRIINECRCHEKIDGEYIYAEGSPASGVCNAPDVPTITPPPPPPPERPEQIRPPHDDGDDEQRNNGDDERGGGEDENGEDRSSSSAPAEPRDGRTRN